METSDARKRRVETSDDQGGHRGGESRSKAAFCGSGGTNYSDVIPREPSDAQIIDVIERLLDALEAAERERRDLLATIARLEGLLAEPDGSNE